MDMHESAILRDSNSFCAAAVTPRTHFFGAEDDRAFTKYRGLKPFISICDMTITSEPKAYFVTGSIHHWIK